MSANRSEFDLIRDAFASGYPEAEHVLLGVGDDCSVVAPPSDTTLAQSIDTQVAGVHFPQDAPAHLIAGRALRCAASDLAAMGAVGQGFHLALTLPDNQNDFIDDFARGLRDTAKALNLPLLGGDTTSGKQLIVTVAVQGWLPLEQGLKRHKARPGQDVWLTGPVGHAALALPTVLANPAQDDEQTAAYYHPDVHLAFGHLLLSLASAAIDVSDGLLQDAHHIARASGVDLSLDAQQIPTAVSQEHPQWNACLSGGDDYQLLFTASSSARDRIRACALTAGLEHCNIIGSVHEATEDGRVIVQQSGQELTFERTGYQHF